MLGMTTNPTPADIAAELDVDLEAVQTVIDQLVDVDGRAATYADAEDTYLTAEAAAFLREALPATVSTTAEWDAAADALTAASAGVAQAQSALESARVGRDDAIRRARRSGWAVADIARAAAVTRQAVYDVLARR